MLTCQKTTTKSANSSQNGTDSKIFKRQDTTSTVQTIWTSEQQAGSEKEKERPLRGNHGTGRTTEKEKETTKESITKANEKEMVEKDTTSRKEKETTKAKESTEKAEKETDTAKEKGKGWKGKEKEKEKERTETIKDQ